LEFKREISGSYDVAIEVGKLIRNIIGQAASKNQTDVNALYDFIDDVGNRLVQAQPIGKAFGSIRKETDTDKRTLKTELVAQNMAKKIIHIVKELSRVSDDADESTTDSEEPQVNQVLSLIRQETLGIIDRIEATSNLIANQAHEHIHSK
jgi:translation initiation factor 2B subunit (eIF-2B alpha/beta/delta family)